MTVARNTSQRDRDRRTIARSKPPCSLCQATIDYSLPFKHPRSYVVDHIVPLSKGGADDLSNKAAAHRDCNRAKSDKLLEECAPRTFVTTRSW